jgi:hypothetical protein
VWVVTLFLDALTEHCDVLRKLSKASPLHLQRQHPLEPVPPYVDVLHVQGVLDEPREPPLEVVGAKVDSLEVEHRPGGRDEAGEEVLSEVEDANAARVALKAVG